MTNVTTDKQLKAFLSAGALIITGSDYTLPTDDEIDTFLMSDSVRDFVNAACKHAGIDITWKGTGIDEKGYWNGKQIISVDPRFFRPKNPNGFFINKTNRFTTTFGVRTVI